MDITLKNCRLAFANIWEARALQAGQDPRFSAVFIMERDSVQHKAVENAIEKVAAEKWPKLPNLHGKTCLRDGTEKADYDGFDEDTVFVSAGSKTKPTCVDISGKKILMQQDGVLYSGCYVLAKIRLWAQDNEYGKRVNAELRGIQFMRDGEPFTGGGRPSQLDEFEDVSEEDNLLA